MASPELQSFLEDRLLALDPNLDLSPGSPAQTKFIDPVLTYLGTDPFETDVDAFILDRFRQEYPDLYAADPGALRDLFIKPLQLILEPFKRETQAVRRGQSLIDPTLLSDDDADALVANLFDSRDEGGYAVGQVRVYFPNPIDVRVESTNRVFSDTGLNYFPTNPVTISAELMVFNREGALYYLDMPVRAEKPGASYNIEPSTIAGIEGIPNVLRATNLRRFSGGSERQDNATFVSAAESSLTERSLANRRGSIARLNSIFKGQLRSVQVIGAKDPEMQRDIIGATSPGHAWITGAVELHDGLAYVQARTIEGVTANVPVPGDTLYVYVKELAQERRFVRLKVEELYIAQQTDAAFEYSYLVRWSDGFDGLAKALSSTESIDQAAVAAFKATLPRNFEGGFSKKGTIKISSLPDVDGQTDFEVPNNEAHVFGRSDVYVRPTTQDVSKVVVDGVYDLGSSGSTKNNPHFTVENLHLVTAANSNQVSDQDSYDFAANGVEVGDLLSIEDGPDAGLYTVGAVSNTVLYLNRRLSAAGSVRYRIMKNVRLNLFEPRISRFPFGDVEQRDLSSTIGEKLVTFSLNDMLIYGAKVGDTLRILSGPDAGDYTIESFDPVLGGKGVYLNKALTSTTSGVSFEVFTPLNPVERPLVRLRELLLLDSAKQSTGLTIPPADPVAVMPTSDLTSAKVLGTSQLPSGYVLPDLSGLLRYVGGAPLQDHAAPAGDRRYSMGFDQADGRYISLRFPDGPYAELDLRSDTSGKTSFFLATTEALSDAVSYPPIDPKPGECLSIKNGPNKGSYLIRAVHKFKYKADATHSAYVYFVQIYGSFPFDPLKQLVSFLQAKGQATGLEVTAGSFPLSFPSFFTNFLAGLGPKVADALNLTSPPSDTEVQGLVESMASCYYEWGMPARGVIRTYFREPTLFQQFTADAPKVTTFSFKTKTGELVRFRPDPSQYQKQEIIPARLSADALPINYPRDLVVESVASVTPAAAFDVGSWIVGGTSGATAKVEAVAQNGAVVLSNITGTFSIGEMVSGSGLSATLSSLSDYDELRFSDASKASVFSAGVLEGDTLAVHEEIFLLGSLERQVIVRTQAGSPLLTALPSAGPSPGIGPFSISMVGSLLFIEDGSDSGGYRVTKYIDQWNVLVDRALTATTDEVSKHGGYATFFYDGTSHIVAPQSGTQPFTLADVGSYITVYGCDYRWMGSFEILSLAAGNGVSVRLPAGAFPATPASGVFWAITSSPATVPVAVERDGAPSGLSPSGTTLLAGCSIRLYESVAKEISITNVRKEVAISSCATATRPTAGKKQPYRIFRPNLRRVTPTELSEKQDGFLYYFDTEVVSLSASPLSNIAFDSYLVVDQGTYKSIGYRHIVEDPNFTYSVKETGYIDLPPFVLPVGSVDSPDSMVRVVGSPLQISYERADLVSLVQSFIESASDRLIGASLLARHFLPAYVSYDASYVGGSDPSVIAKDVRSKIDQTPIETSIDVSELEKVITGRGGNPETPTKVSVTVYDWSRRMWVEFSENSIDGVGSLSETVPYNGSPRVTAFMPGQDVSGLDVLPVGERINLRRL